MRLTKARRYCRGFLAMHLVQRRHKYLYVEDKSCEINGRDLVQEVQIEHPRRATDTSRLSRVL